MKTSNYLLDYYKATNSKREEHRKKCFEQVHNLHIYNYIAIQRMYDTFDLLDNEKIQGEYLWKYKRTAEKICKEYERKVRAIYEDKAYFLLCDYANNYAENLAHDVDILYYTFLNNLTRHNVKRKVVIAHLQVAIMLTSISCDLFDIFFQKYKELTSEDLSHGYKFMRLGKLQLYLQRVQDELGKRESTSDIDFGKDAQCVTAYKSLVNKLSDADLSDNAAKTALELNDIAC